MVRAATRYRAFISYSSADRAVAERLQRALERFKIPAPLRGRDTPYGPLPKRLTPIFRDRSDARAAPDLGAGLSEALAASDALVVLCSPAAARSEWVEREILEFKRLGRASRIATVIADGEPRAFDAVTAPDGAFPRALFASVDPQARVSWGVLPEPLAADVRERGDGLEGAALKVVAALAGLSVTELAQRQAEAERRERRRARQIAAGMAGLAIAAAVGGWLAWRNMLEARARLEDAVAVAARQADAAARFRDAYGVPGAVLAQMLAGADGDFDELLRRAHDTPSFRLERARLQTRLGGIAGVIGDAGAQEARARRALADLDRLSVATLLERVAGAFSRPVDPDDVTAQRVEALEVLARSLAAQERRAEANAALTTAAAEAERAQGRARDPGSWAPLRAEALSQLGDVAYWAGDVAPALEWYEAARAVLEAAPATSATPDDRRDAAYQRAQLLTARAEMLLELEDVDAAVAAQREATIAFTGLAREAGAGGRPDDAAGRLEDAHANAVGRLGDMVLAESGRADEARRHYDDALAIHERLHARDPARADWAANLTATLERVVDALLATAEGAPPPERARLVAEATARQEQVLTLRRTLSERDPSNLGWRRDLAVALERRGDVESAARGPCAATGLYRQALAIREELTTRGGAAAERRVALRDRAVSHWTLARNAVARGAAPSEWQPAFRAAIDAIEPRLEDPLTPPFWARDLAIFHADLGEALLEAGHAGEGRAALARALALTRRLRERYPDRELLRLDERQLEERLEEGPERRSARHASALRVAGRECP